MTKYRMTMMHGKRGSEGQHDFEEEPGLLKHSAMTVLRRSLAAVEAAEGIGHMDFEANAAMKNEDKTVVTAMGCLVFHGEDRQPFVAFISERAS
ncbi:MAG: hypothetical protein AAGG56_10115 [Pseudomonadota bacterium]